MNLEELKILGEINKRQTSIESIIKYYITNNQEKVNKMLVGERYYNNEGDILFINKNLKKDEDPEIKNEDLIPHPWQKILVDQKSSCLFAKSPVFSSPEGTDSGQIVANTLTEDFDFELPELCTEASNKGTAWLYVYIDPDGNLCFDTMKSEEIIPIYDTERQKELVYLLRYYFVYGENDRPYIRVELWDENQVRYFIENDEGEFEAELIERDETLVKNEKGHYYVENSITKKQEQRGWGKIPFIEFPNSSRRIPDIKFYKQMIDKWDKIFSKTGADLTNIQNFIWILENYGGEDLKEFTSDLIKYKAVKLESGGKATTAGGDIPIQAFTEYVEKLKQNIVMFGQGIDPTQNVNSQISGVGLELLYSLLMLKCGLTERSFRKSLRKVFWFINKYNEITGKETFNINEVQTTIRYTKITNESEIVEMCNNSKDVISDETITAHHPWCEMPNEELEKVKKQKEEAQKRQQEVFANAGGFDDNHDKE